ncbi:type II toxin-antitoxin system VapC family toxin [Paracraurococcus lichenis]|uniref:Ribonuclease VapC n=1 Tax=Paracraurococcus lichenis TaxID=3064888 RepID=A0ABT9DZC2_9PROT|nr:type II toxin-antitoxin system VapC family toxin [Paracraurococcus sp. LOR1-02]MDO9709095.1 type II toxin-antitoxin system VapC family toxin [Paracraurococcus sp. LOR1-02]
MTYLDASALVSLFMPDAHTPAIRSHLRRACPAIGIGDFTAAEFAAVTARRVRMRDLTPDQGSRMLAVFDAWVAANAAPLAVDPADIRVAAAFVRRFEFGLRAPDALHLAVCQRLGLPLLTFDARQALAAARLGLALDPAGVAAP